MHDQVYMINVYVAATHNTRYVYVYVRVYMNALSCMCMCDALCVPPGCLCETHMPCFDALPTVEQGKRDQSSHGVSFKIKRTAWLRALHANGNWLRVVHASCPFQMVVDRATTELGARAGLLRTAQEHRAAVTPRTSGRSQRAPSD